MASRITEQDFWISLGVMLKGGAILRQLDPKRNQSVSTPPSMAWSITFLQYSKLSNSTAINNPSALTAFMEGCFRYFTNNSFRSEERRVGKECRAGWSTC